MHEENGFACHVERLARAMNRCNVLIEVAHELCADGYYLGLKKAHAFRKKIAAALCLITKLM
jgi:hypothetical protein